MPNPLLTAPIPAPNPVPGGGEVPVEQMKAVCLKKKITIQAQHEDGSMVLYNIPKGAVAYLVSPDDLEYGQQHSEFKVEIPKLMAIAAAAPIGHKRSQDMAGKAILMILEGIRKNRDLLKEYGLKVNMYEEILENDQKRTETMNALLAYAAWKWLNGTTLSARKLCELRHIEQSWPVLDANEELIYIRIYMKPIVKYDRMDVYAKYVGRTTRQRPIVRQMEHDECIDNRSNLTTHYLRARKYGERHAIPMMILKDTRPEIFPMAETTLCCLLRTWNPDTVGLTHPGVASNLASGNFDKRLLMSTLAEITELAFQNTQYPLFLGDGCNWNCPLQESRGSRREWFRYDVPTDDERGMFVYRTRGHFGMIDCQGHQNFGVFLTLFAGFDPPSHPGGPERSRTITIVKRLENLPGIRLGQPLVVSIEVMKDGNPHPTPWYRHPYHGAWSNYHELHSFAIKHTNMLSFHVKGDSTVTVAWRKATMILQFLFNRKYRNPPPFLFKEFNPDIQDVTWDHMKQTVSLRRIHPHTVDAPTQLSFEDNFRLLLKAQKEWWKEIRVGLKSGVNWLQSGNRSISCICCQIMRKSPQSRDCHKPGSDFPIDQNEQNIDKIRQGSCCLCWTIWRRPCVWLPRHFGRAEGQEWNPSNVVLPEEYKGVGPTFEQISNAIEIEAPMSLDDYYGAKEEIQAMGAEGSGDTGVIEED
ncbi:hypothetical protein FBEOM_8766 [Fusarium beomiforme]|uniref:Uncharacterized protein n=1 Tax=Fusarium beomiforme TaxID=44412 RepID=A0A9P5AEV9_9HYPO|nr:hypothetical protein FBEOM_8766 [Fusarium beomiforme]